MHKPVKGRPRVLLVASTLHVGGAEKVVADLARHINRKKFDVSVCFLRENGLVGETMERDGVELIGLARETRGHPDYWTSLRLMNFVRRNGVQLIHSHDTHGLVDCSIVRSLVFNVKHVHTFHYGNYPHLQANHARLERLVWWRPDRLIAVGFKQSDTIKKFYRISSDRLHVIPNGIGEYQPLHDDVLVRRAAAHPWPVIASISTLTYQKGLTHLLKAIAILKSQDLNVLLLVAGDGPLREELEHQARDLRLGPNVVFLGWVPEASRRLLPISDIFVQSSLWEAMSIVVLEAMSAGKAMVVTNVGENPNVLKDGVSGMLVQPGDAEALAAAIWRLLNQPETAMLMGRNARADYQLSHGVQTMVDAYQAEYESLIGE